MLCVFVCMYVCVCAREPVTKKSSHFMRVCSCICVLVRVVYCVRYMHWTKLDECNALVQLNKGLENSLYSALPVDRKTVCIDKHIQYALCYTI